MAIDLWSLLRDLDDQRRHFVGEPADMPEGLLEESSLEDLRAAREGLKHLTGTIKELLGHIEGGMAAQIQDRSVVYGDSVFRVRARPRRRVIDQDQLWSFIDSLDLNSIRKLFNPNQIRVTGLRAVAAEQGYDPGQLEDTFFDLEWSEPTLIEVPKSKAHAWELELPEGQPERR